MNIGGIEFPDGLHPETVACLGSIMSAYPMEDTDGRDIVAWRTLANNLDLYHDSLESIKEHGMVEISDRGNMSSSPHVMNNVKIQSIIQGQLKDMGLTPASRIKMNKGEKAEEEPLLFKVIRRENK